MKRFWYILFQLFIIGSTVCYSQTPPNERKLIIENIRIEGNHKTKPAVIHRYLFFKKGDPLDAEQLLNNIYVLEGTDFFKDVDIYTEPGSQKGLVNVIIEIIEYKWPSYRFEGGHSDLDGWYISPIGLKMNNFFGRGNYLSYNVKIGNRISGSYLDFKNPDLFHNRMYMGIQLFNEDQDFVHYTGSKDTLEQVWSMGLRFKVGANEGFFKHTFLGYRIAYNRPEIVEELRPLLGRDYKKNWIGAVSTGLITDTRDNTNFPTSGLWGSVTGEIALPWIGSSSTFPKFLFDFRKYKKLTPKSVYAFHIKGGLTGNKAPYYERFFLGGAYSLRGYTFSRLTPPGWGTKMFLLQNEIRFPLGEPEPHSLMYKHTLVLFYDMGGIWKANEIPLFFNIHNAIGFGYRIKLPIINILRFDIAYPMTTIDNDAIRFHLSLGQTF